MHNQTNKLVTQNYTANKADKFCGIIFRRSNYESYLHLKLAHPAHVKIANKMQSYGNIWEHYDSSRQWSCLG